MKENKGLNEEIIRDEECTGSVKATEAGDNVVNGKSSNVGSQTESSGSTGSTDATDSTDSTEYLKTTDGTGPSESIEEMEAKLALYEAEKLKAEKKAMKAAKTKENVKVIVKDVAIACAIALVISFFFRPTLVRETSMEPSVHPNDYLIMSKQAYTLGKIHRGDVIVFKSDLKLDEKHNKLLIKRVIGISGDIITISDGNVYRNGEKLEEEYIAEGGTIGEIYNLVIPDGEVFVMGDHRSVSIDSRKLGCIKEEDIVGRAILRLYPFNQIGVI